MSDKTQLNVEELKTFIKHMVDNNNIFKKKVKHL